jgi:hypothetical protein
VVVTITDSQGKSETFSATTRHDEGDTTSDMVAVFDRGSGNERRVPFSDYWIDVQP